MLKNYAITPNMTTTIAKSQIPKTLPNIQKFFGQDLDDIGAIFYSNYNQNSFSKQKDVYRNNNIDYKVHYFHNQTVLINTILKKYKPLPISLKQLTKYDDMSSNISDKQFKEKMLIESANFIRQQLIIRIGLKIKEFQSLPFKISSNKHLFKVYKSYYSIFENFRKFPRLKTIEDNEKFLENTQKILSDLNLVNLFNLIMGGLEISSLKYMPKKVVDNWINELLRARISRRLMIEEHISLSQRLTNTKNIVEKPKDLNIAVLGDIFQLCDLKQNIDDIAKSLNELMANEYATKGKKLPNVIIDGEKDLKLYFLPIHLRFMLNEILRNSFEATLENDNIEDSSDITITVIKNEKSVILRISDHGGGLPLNTDKNTITSFGKPEDVAMNCLKALNVLTRSTVDEIVGNTSLETLQYDTNLTSKINEKLNIQLKIKPETDSDKDSNFEKPLLKMLDRERRFKLGIGLALSKVYAEYWNGSLELHSLDGYGTDVVLTLGDLVYYGNKLCLDRV